MSTYVSRSCANCKFPIEGWTRAYLSIDIPFTDCPRCKQLIVFEHKAEWDTRTVWQKLSYYVMLAYTAMILAIVIPFLYLVYTEYQDVETSTHEFTKQYSLRVSLGELIRERAAIRPPSLL